MSKPPILKAIAGEISSNDHLKIMLIWVRQMALILILGEAVLIIVMRLCGVDDTVVLISVSAISNIMSMSIGIIIARITLRDSVSELDKEKRYYKQKYKSKYKRKKKKKT